MCPRKALYRRNREFYVKKQQEYRRQKKEKIAKALQELARLEQLQQQTLDNKAFETEEVKKAIRKQFLEDSEDSDDSKGARLWT